ncbi:hypothetical protein APHAL10511_004304 [Amanita phalloides]|nr:hypothetical protein APHAL10511_004304 [Amanita phalloides]
MRVSVPSLPHAILTANSSTQEAIHHLSNFIRHGNLTVITGAGVSVDSGIRAYRGHDGRYMYPNYKPILYHEFVDEGEKGHLFRQRYWLRSYLGYPPVRDTQPNPTHFALAALQHTGYIGHIITQNVDGLHHKALTSKASNFWTSDRLDRGLLELHGSIHRVVCRSGHTIARETFQDQLSIANPKWQAFAEEMELGGGKKLRTNPDGDVAVEHLGLSYESFVVPACPHCFSEKGTHVFLKPEFIFFGESIPQPTKIRSHKDVEISDRVLLMGTTLATYSSFRLVKHALELRKPVLMLNVGPTRADDLTGVTKIELPTGTVMRDVAKAVIGHQLLEGSLVNNILYSGIVKPPGG